MRVVRHSLHILEAPETYLKKAARDEHPRVRLESLSAASWHGGKSGAEVLLTVASQKTDKWTRNALNSAMLLLKPEVESIAFQWRISSRQPVYRSRVAAEQQTGRSGKTEKNYRTKSEKFKDGDFARAYALGERVFYEEGSCYTCHRDHGEWDRPDLSSLGWQRVGSPVIRIA